jgi:hypothetical protein
LQQLANVRVLLERLELRVRVGRRVLVIEAGDETERQQIVAHEVREAAAERLHVERPAERVDHAPLVLRVAAGDAPQFLDTGRVHLRVLAAVELVLGDQLLRQRAARAFGQDRQFRANVDAGLVVGLLLAVLVDALVAGAHADHAIAVMQQFGGGEAGEDLDAELLDLRREPAHEPRDRHDAVAVVVDVGRQVRRLQLAALREEPDFVRRHRDTGTALFFVVGHQFLDRPRIHDRARQHVVADLRSLLEHDDRQFADLVPAVRTAVDRVVVLLDRLLQPVRRGQAARTTTDDQDVDFEGFALLRHGGSAGFRSPVRADAKRGEKSSSPGKKSRARRHSHSVVELAEH